MSNDQNESDTPPEEVTNAFRDSILSNFSEVEEPRTRLPRIKHSLGNVIFITLCAVLCGANNLKEVATYARSRKEWLASVLDLPNGVPKYNTLWWFFLLLKPKSFNEAFAKWVSSLSELTKGQVIAIDGKASRGTAPKGEPNSFIHMVSLWACEQGLTLGQVKVDEKSNEITAIPELLKLIDLSGTIVTIDAMGTQIAIADEIQSAGADYILALKGNQSNLHAEVRNFFNQAEDVEFQGVAHSLYNSVEKGHGRVEKRTVHVTEEIDWLPQLGKWKGLKSIVMVISERAVEGQTSLERRYYITSLPADAQLIAYSIRSHWGIENQCHWVLDVGFREDARKARAGNIAANHSIVTRMAHNILRQDTETDGGMEIKRKQAGWNPLYLLKLMGIKFS